MKKKVFIIIHTLVLIAVILCSCIEHQPAAVQKTKLYSKTTVVSEIDKEKDLVICEDCEGELWVFEGCEGWQEGDFASLLMDTCNTENIYDDEIVEVNYCGNIQGLV